jgi:hypothetical protein
MNTLKQAVPPVLIILLAAAIMIFGLTLLDDTEWADSFRGEPSAQSVDRAVVSNESESLVNGIIRSVDAFLKVVLFMGIPAFFTLRVLRIINPKPKKRSGLTN